MTNDSNSREILERIARAPAQKAGEISVVTAPGARAAAWAVKVKSLSSYNVYNVIAVVIGSAGSVPVEIGSQMKAVNMAEDFLQQGTLASGACAIMFRVGDKNIFHVAV